MFRSVVGKKIRKTQKKLRVKRKRLVLCLDRYMPARNVIINTLQGKWSCDLLSLLWINARCFINEYLPLLVASLIWIAGCMFVITFFLLLI